MCTEDITRRSSKGSRLYTYSCISFSSLFVLQTYFYHRPGVNAQPVSLMQLIISAYTKVLLQIEDNYNTRANDIYVSKKKGRLQHAVFALVHTQYSVT